MPGGAREDVAGQRTTGDDLSSSEYGMLFLPQVVLGSVGFPGLGRRFTPQPLLLAGLLGNTSAQAGSVDPQPAAS